MQKSVLYVLGCICCKTKLLLNARLLSSDSSGLTTTIKTTVPANIKVFDRNVKRIQRNTAGAQTDFETYCYVKDEFGARIADRVFDLIRFNEVCLDIGCGAGHIAPHLIKDNVGILIQCDMSQKMVERSRGAPNDEFPTLRVIADEELVPFRNSSIDLILNSLSAHWINDLPGWFRRCYNILRPDGCMIGALFSGETLHQLRVSLQLAELERLGGLGAHISPFVESQDIGSLMTKAGFSMITLDVDELEVGYPNMFALIHDLQGMAESNANSRRNGKLRREVLIAADAIYKELYAVDGKYPATFQVISFIGWRPSSNMPQPAKRGSQNVSFKDISKVVESQEDFVIKK